MIGEGFRGATDRSRMDGRMPANTWGQASVPVPVPVRVR